MCFSRAFGKCTSCRKPGTQPTSQQELLHFVTDLLAAWRKTRLRVLALGSLALVRRRRLTLCGIARGLDSTTRVLHRVKRIWRFLSNPGGGSAARGGGARPPRLSPPHGRLGPHRL